MLSLRKSLTASGPRSLGLGAGDPHRDSGVAPRPGSSPSRNRVPNAADWSTARRMDAAVSPWNGSHRLTPHATVYAAGWPAGFYNEQSVRALRPERVQQQAFVYGSRGWGEMGATERPKKRAARRFRRAFVKLITGRVKQSGRSHGLLSKEDAPSHNRESFNSCKRTVSCKGVCHVPALAEVRGLMPGCCAAPCRAFTTSSTRYGCGVVVLIPGPAGKGGTWVRLWRRSAKRRCPRPGTRDPSLFEENWRTPASSRRGFLSCHLPPLDLAVISAIRSVCVPRPTAAKGPARSRGAFLYRLVVILDGHVPAP